MTRCQRCFGELSEFVVFCPNCAQVHEPDLSQLLNQTVGERYKLYRHLGQGGLSTVFAATDLQTDNVVVVKVSDPAQLVRRELTYAIDAEAARNYWQEMLERMRHEAEALTGIDHPNIVRFFDTGMIGEDLRFVVMEFLRGRMLREELDERGRLETAEAANIALQLCEALGEVHARGIVHRDISPRNVMLSGDVVTGRRGDGATGRLADNESLPVSQSPGLPVSGAKLIDFGIAKFPQPPGAPPFTQHSVLSGTVAYASPEQCQSRAVDHRSDIYSMGVMLYEMLTGERPFTGRTPTEIAIKHLQAAPQPPRQLNPEIPVSLEKTILRALAKAPEDRQQDIQELANEIRSSSRQVVIPLVDDSSADFGLVESSNRLTLVRRRRRRVALAVAALLLAVLAGGIFGKNWLASHALPLFAANQPAATPSPESPIASDLDSLELAAQLPGDVLSGGVASNSAGSASVKQPTPTVGSQTAAPTSGNAAPGISPKTTAQPNQSNQSNQLGQSSQPAASTQQTAKNQAQATPVVAANKAPLPAGKTESVEVPPKSEDRKIRPRDADSSANPANDTFSREAPAARRDRIATSRDRDEGNYRRDSKDDEGGNGSDADNRHDSEQIGPKLIQWSGRVKGEREVVIDLPGVPGTVEIPRVYRDRVGMVEPPSASNRWRCARLRVFGDGGTSFVVRWWPMANQFTKLAGRQQ